MNFFQNQVILETIANKNIVTAYKYYRSKLVLSSISLFIGFILIIIFSIIAPIKQIWGLFSLVGLGFIIIISSAMFLSWYSKRFIASKELIKLDTYLKNKDFHFVIDIASFLQLDQRGTLYILKCLLKNNYYENYQIYNDIILALKSYDLTDEKVKKEYGKRKDLGTINYHNLKINCPYCKAKIDFSFTKCPYCQKELI